MKKKWTLLSILFTAVMVVWDTVELLAVPALFTVIGLLNGFPWPYYAISIGGYFALLGLGELAAHLIFRALDKKYTPILRRKLEKLFGESSEEV